MAEMDDRLKRLVSDEQSMKRVLDMASAIMAQRNAAHAAPEKAAESAESARPAEPAAAAQPDMASLLSALLQSQKKEDPAGEAPAAGAAGHADPAGASGTGASAESESQKNTAAALADSLPQLMQALSGNGNLVDGNRTNLIKAMKPYLSERRIGSLDRALRMANVTKAAKSALHILGR
ncbi:MAG: hypothetical protein VB086_07035 [Clostridiaceae bacterium]|nr:hypothetical protein [Clostridiaceae bacterium]